MTGFKKKIRFKTIISVVLVIVTLAGLAYGISRITKNDTKNVRSNYITGTLDVSNGELIENDKSIVSKEMFSCYGLTVTPDFDAYSSYQIFWYNMDKIYCGHTEVIKGVFSSNLPECAKYCRIVITPNKDQLGDDGKINFLEVSKFAGKIKVEVAKDQSVLQIGRAHV